MASNDATKLIWTYGNLFLGPAGATPTTAVGYMNREAELTITLQRSDDKFYGHNSQFPIIARKEFEGGTVTGEFAQFEPELFAYAMGIDADGQEIKLNSQTTYNELAVKVIATRRDGKTFLFRALRVQPSGDFKIALSRKEPGVLPFEAEILQPNTGDVFAFGFDEAGTVTATIATGVLTRTASAGYHKVAGEGGAADELDSITGASLTKGERLRLQIASATAPITLKHLVGTLELTGSADWVMSSIYDYIDLQYDETGTKWVEIGRHDHTA